MHIAELAQVVKIDHLYRCDSMPANRWRLWGSLEGDTYLRPDGQMETFTGLMDDKKYHADETWHDCGPVYRNRDRSIDLSKLPVTIACPPACP